jgi:prepilin-type N-terminal cleavage/methylation domain-containing protein
VAKDAFTLIELLVVIAVIAVMAALIIPSIAGLNTAGNINSAVYQIKGVLETSRSYATANNTYVWVGFYEEAASAPQTPGVGRIIISVVASADGSMIYTMPLSTTAVTPLNPTRLIQVAKLTKISNMHLNNFPAGTGTGSSFATRPSAGAAAQIGNLSSASPATFPSVTFQFPVGSSASAQYTFSTAIQFNPRGEVQMNNSSNPISSVVEIGMQSTHGAVVDAAGLNVAAVQITGIAGNVNIYRP